VTAAERLELAREVRLKANEVIGLLQRPSKASLDQSAAELSAAISAIESLRQGLVDHPSDGSSKAVLTALRSDLRRVSRLLGSACDLRFGPGGQSEYTQKGEWRRRPLSTVRFAIEG
jgi:hypothetical protein